MKTPLLISLVVLLVAGLFGVSYLKAVTKEQYLIYRTSPDTIVVRPNTYEWSLKKRVEEELGAKVVLERVRSEPKPKPKPTERLVRVTGHSSIYRVDGHTWFFDQDLIPHWTHSETCPCHETSRREDGRNTEKIVFPKKEISVQTAHLDTKDFGPF